MSTFRADKNPSPTMLTRGDLRFLRWGGRGSNPRPRDYESLARTDSAGSASGKPQVRRSHAILGLTVEYGALVYIIVYTHRDQGEAMYHSGGRGLIDGMKRAWLVLLLIPLAACGGGATSNADALHQAVDDYSVAYLSGDGAGAYAILSIRCAAKLGQHHMDVLASGAAQLFTPEQPATFGATITGDRAKVTYTFSESALNQFLEAWVLEDGHWRMDDC